MQLRLERDQTAPVCNKSHPVGGPRPLRANAAAADVCRAERVKPSAAPAHNRSRATPLGAFRLRAQPNAQRAAMNAVNHASDARLFYRSEAFPEDVADLVEPSLQASVKAAPMPQRSRSVTMLWLLGLLPLVVLAVGVTWAF
jgi:hypothetical protein